MSVTVEEKIRLFEEVGLTTQAQNLKSELEIARLSSLKFKPITEDEIKKLLCSKPYSSEQVEQVVWKSFWKRFTCKWGIMGRGSKGAEYCDRNCGKHVRTVILPSESFPVLDSMLIESWPHAIPYGAALAIKEAKEAGLTDFKIYFPSTEKGFLRRHDPVVVGFAGRSVIQQKFLNTYTCSYSHSWQVGEHSHTETIKEGIMMNVFAWDDGAVFE